MAGKLVIAYRCCSEEPSELERTEVQGLIDRWLEDDQLRPLGKAFQRMLLDLQNAVEVDVAGLEELERLGAILDYAERLGVTEALGLLEAAADNLEAGGDDVAAQAAGGRTMAMPDAWDSDAHDLRADAGRDYRRRWNRENAALIGKVGRGVRGLTGQRRARGRTLPMPSDEGAA